MKIVTDAGYHGFVGIEYEGSRLSEPEGIKATKKLLESLRGSSTTPGLRRRARGRARGLTANALTGVRTADRRRRYRDGPYRYAGRIRHDGSSESTRGMDPVGVDRTHILVLNYNGRALLERVPALDRRGGQALAGPVRA